MTQQAFQPQQPQVQQQLMPAGLMQQQHQQTSLQMPHQQQQQQQQHNQLNSNHVPPPAYDEAIHFNHAPLDVNSYFNSLQQQSYGSNTYDYQRDHLDHHYLTPSPG